MTVEQARAFFLSLPSSRKPLFVALLAHNLTIFARGWVPGSSADETVAGRYWTFNELQHTVSGKLLAIGSGESERFPDEDFLDVLFERAQTGNCERELLQAFSFAAAAKV